MYVYIYDEFLGSGRHDKALHKIEKRLTDLGLNGKTIRLGTTKNLKTSIDDEIRQGAKTIVAVGNDSTVSKVINVMANNQSDEKYRLCLGMIPMEGKNSRLAGVFGVKNLNDACEILLSRRVESFSLAAVNDSFFLFKAEAMLNEAVLEIDKEFIIQPTKSSSLEIKNNPSAEKNDRTLSLAIKDGDSKSLLDFKELILVNKGTPLITDGALEIETPAKISLSDEKIKIIIGKNREI